MPDGWDLEKLLGAHASHPYNPDLANAFFRAGEIESWGRGMERIFSACRDAKSPVPEIQLDGHDLWVEFPYSKTYMEKLQGDISSKNTAVKSSGKSSGKGSGKSSEVIITMLRNNKTMTIPELAEALSISTRAVEKNIQKLQNAGRLKRIGPAKGGYWDVLN